MSFFILCIFLFSSCGAKYENPHIAYDEAIIKKIKTKNAIIKKEQLESKITALKQTPKKATLIAAPLSHGEPIGFKIFATVFFIGLYPICLLGGIFDKNLDVGERISCFVPGLVFWYPHNLKEPREEIIAKINEDIKLSDAELEIKCTNCNNSTSYKVKTDSNGNLILPLKDEFYQYEKIKLELSYHINTKIFPDRDRIEYYEAKTNININLIDYYKNNLGLNDANINKYKNLQPVHKIKYIKLASLSKEFFFKLSPGLKDFIISTSFFYNLSKKEQITAAESFTKTNNNNNYFGLLAAVVTGKMNSYLNPEMPEKDIPPKPPLKPKNPDFIPEPELPPVMEIAQDPFETKSMFSERMKKAKEKRNKQIKDILAEYRHKVEKRNFQIEKMNEIYKKEYEKYLLKIKEYKVKQENKIKIFEQKVKYRRAMADSKKNELLYECFDQIFGNPSLKQANNKDNTPKYDPENKVMIASLFYGNKNKPILEQEISFKGVSAGETARSFYNDLKNGKIEPVVSKSFAGNQMSIISVKPKNSTYASLRGKPFTENFKTKKMGKVFIGYNDFDKIDDTKKENYQSNLMVPEYQKPEELIYQSSNIKDVKFEIYVSKELKKFNDDIPSLLKKAEKNKKDPKKWLFVIGVEDYQNTNKINFSSRSAEMFTDVALKTLGIPEYNTFLLIDDAKPTISSIDKKRIYPNTAGSIKDQLRYLIKSIDSGDKIYFYYSGHGIPSINDDKKPYILAKDQSPDFIHEEKSFCVDEIYKELTKSKADKIIVFMDSCFTGETDGNSVYMGSKAATKLAPKNIRFNSKKMVVMCAGN
jgi:hypothetical protein